MFSIRRNWGMMGRIFGVPRAILSRICAFCSSWTVEGNLVKLTIPEFPDPEKNPIRLSINEDALLALCGGGSGRGSVHTVDGHSPDANGAVSFGLTASRPVITNASGHLTSLGAAGITSSSLTVVSNVAWSATNHKLTLTKRTLTLNNGIITSIGTESTSDIDVATLVTWA